MMIVAGEVSELLQCQADIAPRGRILPGNVNRRLSRL